ncbi:DoxX family protein [Labrys monachus]|uniref:Oxidoreductase n=1 Tax=Labrys monachus TaxID=217067 RepID=A0ABU0FNQ8_9HYPH|nr:DoxX family protein [Labrys monachus]MDQ0396245.1 putative oxidoreductase [Labrys monachus]
MESLPRYVALAGHVLVALLFLHESWFKITHLDLTIAYMAHYGLPAFLLPGALAVELLGGLALVTGFGRRYADYVLAVFCVVTTSIFHTDWADLNQLQHFEKDLALAGALLVMAVTDRTGADRSV